MSVQGKNEYLSQHYSGAAREGGMAIFNDKIQN